jgi:hypothetical protein
LKQLGLFFESSCAAYPLIRHRGNNETQHKISVAFFSDCFSERCHRCEAPTRLWDQQRESQAGGQG